MNQVVTVKHQELDYSLFSSKGIELFLSGKTVDPTDLFLDIRSYINRFVYFMNKRHLDLFAVWIMGTYVFPIFRHYPYLWLNAEKGSGKTTTLEVISPICFNGQILVCPTPAVLFREVSANRVTLLIDEFEQMTKQDKEIGGAVFDILNAGYNREGQVKRTESTQNGGYRLRTFGVYSPKAFSGINSIDNVLRDRTIQVRLLRKAASDLKERYKITPAIEALQQQLRNDCYIFALSQASKVAEAYNSGIIERDYLKHLNNRELDLWEPLVSILHLIDEENILGYMSPVLALSKQSFEDKSADDMEDNRTSKIILKLRDLLDSDIEFKNIVEDGKKLRAYRAQDVVDFNDQDIAYGCGFDQAKLTKQLKALNIIVKQRRWGEDQERPVTYAFSHEQVNELMDRFNLSNAV